MLFGKLSLQIAVTIRAVEPRTRLTDDSYSERIGELHDPIFTALSKQHASLAAKGHILDQGAA